MGLELSGVARGVDRSAKRPCGRSAAKIAPALRWSQRRREKPLLSWSCSKAIRRADLNLTHLLADIDWARIPVLSSASVVAHARDMCTRPPETLDTGSTGGPSGTPVKFYLDRSRSPIEYAFVHEAWSRAGFHAGDPRCVFRGVELNNADETHIAI